MSAILLLGLAVVAVWGVLAFAAVSRGRDTAERVWARRRHPD
jgi:hypothetical protein